MGLNESDLQFKLDIEKKLVSDGNASGSEIVVSAGPNVYAVNALPIDQRTNKSHVYLELSQINHKT